ncbi:MAG TPA: DUF1990 domain-containing protein [Candidatus Tumulicola sp.]|jgi:uncharacterized protein (UPF0548 family)
MSESERRRILFRESLARGTSPRLLTLGKGRIGTLPAGFVHDRSCVEIGRGARVLAVAREAFLRWRQFDMGWVTVVDPTAAIADGQVIGVEAHTAGLWSLNVCRILETVDTANRSGFLYETTATHVEDGQERFVIDLDPTTQIVSYCIEAVSRPRHPLVWLAYPFGRAMQRRFVQDSFAQMRDVSRTINP